MLLPSWLCSTRSAQRPPSKRPLFARLQIESLEDRFTLSASLVADIVPGAEWSRPSSLTNVNGALYFGTTDPATGAGELRKSDGTAAGTVLLKMNLGSAPSKFTPLNGSVFFGNSTGLWKTDGTTAGTVLVKSVVPMDSMVEVNGKLFFKGYDAHDQELWVSDGTTTGTKLVKDIYSGSTGGNTGSPRSWGGGGGGSTVNSSNPEWLTNFNGTLYFAATDGSNGRSLWKSDGTAKGTKLVAAGMSPQYLTVANQTLYFGALGGSNSAGLWKSDGTAGGTMLIKPFESFGGYDGSVGQENEYGPTGYAFFSTNAQYLTNVNGTIFFEANDGVHGPALWKSDGTPAGTVFIKYVGPGGYRLTKVNDSVYFLAGASGRELWKSDGTTAGTELVSSVRVLAASNALLTNVGPLTYFAADDGVHGVELWQTDGTTAGTTMVQDIYPGSSNSYPLYLTGMNNKLYFSANDGVHGRELWDPPAVGGSDLLVVGDPERDPIGLGSIQIPITDLGGATLELVSGNTIWLHDDVAGWGWFFDPMPSDDAKFTTPGNQDVQKRMDLLTVVMYELRHLLGHDDDRAGVMAETLAAGVRRAGVKGDHVASVDHLIERLGDQHDFAWLGAWLDEQFDSMHERAKRRR